MWLNIASPISERQCDTVPTSHEGVGMRISFCVADESEVFGDIGAGDVSSVGCMVRHSAELCNNSRLGETATTMLACNPIN